MRPTTSTVIKRFAAVAIAATALAAAAAAQAQVTWSIGVESPTYYEPAPVYRTQPPPAYYQPAPPAYYEPAPPAYYGPPPEYRRPPPPPAYYRQAPGYEEQGEWRGGRGYEQPRYDQPRLSDMQQRALNNCGMLAWRDQPRCRATVMSTVR